MVFIGLIFVAIYLGGKLDDITSKIEEVANKKFK